ncbi:MAG: hypothetical protein IPF52_00055 [Saprospiraceae bacterium]|nr:hypothetical protein [Saprospiraceae bacterium]
MRKIYLFCIGVFISFSSQSQILYLDNWKDIEGVKKITVSHYSALESLGEINVDKQLVKVVGVFNAEGKVVEEKVFFSEYDQPRTYHIFYNHTNGKVMELFHDYYEFSNREAGFKERIKFKYNQLGEIMVAETWCNLNTVDCGATVLDKNEYFILKVKNRTSMTKIGY